MMLLELCSDNFIEILFLISMLLVNKDKFKRLKKVKKMSDKRKKSTKK
jgi:hypothetical protein